MHKLIALIISLTSSLVVANEHSRPNFLLIITDDQSWSHTSIEGYPIETPNLERMANNGMYFSNGFVSAPNCTASRSALMTGQDFYRTGNGATLMGKYPDAWPSFQKILKENGYATGVTGKIWGPGRPPSSAVNQLGKSFNKATMKNELQHHSPLDYAANLDEFLLHAGDKPFSFIIGILEPHRPFIKKPDQRFTDDQTRKYLPPVFPRTDYAIDEFSSYIDEIEYLDKRVGEIFDTLEFRGKISNTLVVFISDNGMPFPGAKANNSYYGNKVPFIARWDEKISAKGNKVLQMVSAIDLAPTFLDAAGIDKPEYMTGISLLPILEGNKAYTWPRNYVVTGFERHGYSRCDNKTYPSRAIITEDYIYIHNRAPDRWPQGEPPNFTDTHRSILSNKMDLSSDEYINLENWLLGKRPEEELYDIREDPFQRNNLLANTAGLFNEPAIKLKKESLKEKLEKYLHETSDPGLTNPDHFSSNSFLGKGFNPPENCPEAKPQKS